MAGQLALDDRWTDRPRPEPRAAKKVLCAACQAREARYGFRGDADDPQVERPRTLCFECFRAEIGRRQEAAQAVQGRLPLEQTLDLLSRRRRRAQIAARHALALAQTS
jgi:hypothetical protein